MKLLHTSDWHVGRTMRGLSRDGEHEAVLAEIAHLADVHRVDLVLVTGDLFDTAAPSPEAERIVYRALLELEATGAHVVVLAGNHDNHRRLAAVAPLLRRGAVSVVSEVSVDPEKAVVKFAAADGTPVEVACVPFVPQRAAVRAAELLGGDAASHVQEYAGLVGEVVAALSRSLSPGVVRIGAAHLFAAGATVGDSERVAHVAMGYAVSAQAFDARFHYVGLGHLHRPQAVGAANVRYAGSPLQLDFGEAGEEKSVVLVEATPTTAARIELLPVRAGRPLVEVRGTLEQLRARVDEQPDLLDAHVKVRLQERGRVGLVDDVRAVLPNAVDVVLDLVDAGGDAPTRPSRAGRSPVELFHAYLEESGVSDPRIEALFVDLLEEVSGAA